MDLFPAKLQHPKEPGAGLSEQYWKSLRLRYNGMLLLSFILAFAAYVVILDRFKATILPHVLDSNGRPTDQIDSSADVNPFSACCALSLYFPFANLVYGFGAAWQDELPQTPAIRKVVKKYPEGLWWAFTALSAAPPWIVPTMHLIAVTFFPHACQNASAR